ncbi:MAG: patatin-like phospholipase family protein [Methyloligellaceae bacterium]
MTKDSKRLNILCLSGGGYRGLFTAELLNKVAKGLKVDNLQSHFDLFIGTSTGGLIATALSYGIPPRRIVQAYQKHGPRIFPSKTGLEKFISWRRKGAIYDKEAISDAIQELIPDNYKKPIQNEDVKLALVTASSITKSYKLLAGKRFSDSASSRISVHDAIQSTTAAPVYFSPQNIGNDQYIDGGLIANAPSMIGAALIMDTFKEVEPEAIHVLHIGTASSLQIKKPRNKPRFYNMFFDLRDMIHYLMATQELLSIKMAQTWLTERRYVYVDAPPLLRQGVELENMDDASKDVEERLMLLAEHTWLEWKDRPELNAFFYDAHSA